VRTSRQLGRGATPLASVGGDRCPEVAPHQVQAQVEPGRAIAEHLESGGVLLAF